MYYDLRDRYWWPGMKKDIAEYVSRCWTCLKVKDENQRPSGLLQQPEIPIWKWEGWIAMDFLTMLPRTCSGALHQIGYCGPDRIVVHIRFWQSKQEAIELALDYEYGLIHPQTMVSVGDYVLLKVSPWKGVVRFGKKGKLAPRFVGPFEIIEKVGPVAYRLDLPKELNGVHDTLHVSNLKKCLADPTLKVPLNEIQIDAKLNFVEEPVEILEREFKKLKRSRITIVKVRWNPKRGPEFTWEREDQMKLKYPHLFSDVSI
ncbi:retrotransposon protein, putative, ty3-gypsy subclass [Tanacetum coccineum]